MAYNAYRPAQQQHAHYHHPPPGEPYTHAIPLYTNQAPTYTSNIPLKPIPQQTTATTTTTSYTLLTTNNGTTAASTTASLDATHKRRIRRLKLLARILATLLSLATFIPLAMTLVKFFQTRNQTLVVDGASRTAWALGGSITWYTYLYFGVATVSLALNALVLLSYCCGGHRSAERTAGVESWWANFQRGVEVLVWIASVAIYRYGKEPDAEGKFKDLWGWTCSPAARAIQGQVPNVNFDVYCNVQTASFYTGILNVLASILTGVIYIYAVVRWRSKSKLAKASAMEPLRY